MKTKTGIVMEIKGNIVYIMTQSGEFEKVKIKNNKPYIGEIYTGKVYKKYNGVKYFVSAASVFLCVVLASSSYAYYRPVNSLVVKINNVNTKININKFNKIIDVSITKEKSDNLVESLKLKHKDINDALTKIVDVSKQANNENELLVEIKTNNKSERKLDIEKFQENMQEKSIDYTIYKNNNEENNLKNKDKEVKIDTGEITDSNNTEKDSNTNSNVNSNKKNNEKNNEENDKKNDEKNDDKQNQKDILDSTKKDEKNNNKNSDTKNKIIIEINQGNLKDKSEKKQNVNKNNDKKTN